MNQLKELQKAFQKALTRNDGSFANQIVKPKDMAASDRLQVYFNDYFYRLRDSLKEDFEKTYKMLGDDNFESLVKGYLERYPSKTYTLREIGYNFPQFLQEQSQDPAIVEMAIFECEIIRSLFSEDAQLLDLEDLASVNLEEWPGIRLKLHPSIHEIMGRYNTLDLWLSIENNEGIASQTLPQPVLYLVWRKDNHAYFRELDNDESLLFDSIKRELTFADLCEKMLERFDEESVVPWVSQILQLWIADGLFCNFHRAQ